MIPTFYSFKFINFCLYRFAVIAMYVLFAKQFASLVSKFQNKAVKQKQKHVAAVAVVAVN